MKLVVLGPSQSGKTCLAVGLANTSYGKELFKSAFVATAKGTTSREHLTNLRLMLEGAEWPGGTKDSKAKTLDFEFQWKNDKVDFSFDDYNGENVTQKDFRVKLENLGEEDGVALLVNPGLSYSYVEEQVGSPRLASDAEIVNGKTDSGLPVLTASAFDDSPLARKWLVGQEKIYEQLIEDLSTKNGGNKSGKPIVALTVTASDRLNSDLSKIRPRFEAFLEKIKNRLDTGHFKWRPFEVSITGILEDQSKPKLAGGLSNTSAEPFLWLLGRLAWRIRFEVWKKRAMLGSVIAAGFALCVGIYAWVAAGKDAENLRRWEVSCNNHLDNARNNNNSEGVKAEKELDEAIKEYSKIRKHHGFYEEKAIEAADRLEVGIWEVQKRLIEDRIRDIDESQGKQGGEVDCDKVERLFARFKPSVSSNKVGVAYTKQHYDWETKKPGFLEKNSIWQLKKRVQEPIGKCIMEHGEAVMSKLYPLYDVISSVEPKSKKVAAVKMELASNLDSRVEREWQNFAMPDFDKAATTNASHDVTRAFVTLLKSWEPATTNGVAAKAKLYTSVTNSVPRWRELFEQSTFRGRIDNAIKSGDITKLAVFYPERVMESGGTNDYLTVSYVKTQWEQRVCSQYEVAYGNYITNIINAIVKRRGRPKCTDDDRKCVDEKAQMVGYPFDAAATKKTVENIISSKGVKWDSDKKNECEKWVSDKVNADRERTGRSSLWTDYETFMRNSRNDNPFAESVVRPKVYRQIEEWFEDDCNYFKKNLVEEPIWADALNLGSNFGELEKRFNSFSKLCEAVNGDKAPEPCSWAYHFAKFCVENGRVRDGIYNAFPQTLVVSSIEGEISYYDYKKNTINYPTNYKRTSFAARVEVVQHESDGSVQACSQRDFLPFDGKHAKDSPENSCDATATSKVLENSQVRVPIHAFEEVRVIAAATDYNKLTWAETSSKGPFFIAKYDENAQSLHFLNNIDLSFDKLPRRTGSDTPNFELHMEAKIEGESIGGLLSRAKEVAGMGRTAVK